MLFIVTIINFDPNLQIKRTFMNAIRFGKPFAKYTIVAAIIFTLSGCFIHVGGGNHGSSGGNGVSSVFGGLEISEGKQVSNVSSVNGSIELHDSVTANAVDTVNGSIEISDYVTVESAKTVNGDIETGEHFVSHGPVETVNGDIKIKGSSTLHEDAETVNGDIRITDAKVKGSLHTHNGDITLEQNSKVIGDIVYHSNHRKQRYNNTPTLTIKQGSIVEGQIILKREVELDIEDAELLRKVSYQYDKQ